MANSTIDDYSPHMCGDLSDPLQCYFWTKRVDPLTGKRIPYDISGVQSLTVIIKNRSNGTVTTGTGTWANINGANGYAEYQWSSADVATEGLCEISIKLVLPNGPKHTLTKIIEFVTPDA